MKNTFAETKQVRIEKSLQTIRELYDLTFKIKNAEKLAKYKSNLELVNDEKKLVECCKIISKQIKDIELIANTYPDEDIYHATSYRLRLIYTQITDLIKEEFRTLRTRNNRIPRLEI